jgi:Flp pilus assembly pilin Flp
LTRISKFTERLQAEAGQTMAEYAVVLAVITLAVVLVLTTLSGAIGTKLSSVIAILSSWLGRSTELTHSVAVGQRIPRPAATESSSGPKVSPSLLPPTRGNARDPKRQAR